MRAPLVFYHVGVDRDFYSVTEAAKILKLTTGRVRQMLRSGALEGISPEDTGERGWRIPMRIILRGA